MLEPGSGAGCCARRCKPPGESCLGSGRRRLAVISWNSLFLPCASHLLFLLLRGNAAGSVRGRAEQMAEGKGIEFGQTLPYAYAALLYFQAGWLPVPVRGKSAPVRGFTGRDGALVTEADIRAWAEGEHAGCNLAVRMRPSCAGIDVDGYHPKDGATVMAALAGELGPLPPSWRSTSRTDDTVSGISFFTVPAGAELGDLDAELQVIRHSWRFGLGFSRFRCRYSSSQGTSFVPS